MYCRNCYYDLRATENRCPECGRVFNPDDPSTYIRIEDDPKSDRRFAIVFSVVSLTLVGSVFLGCAWIVYSLVRFGFWQQ